MGDFSILGGGQRFESLGTSNALGTAIAYSGSTNTKNAAWTQLVAATSFDASGFIVDAVLQNDGRQSLVDIAIGAAASEQIIIANLLVAPSRGYQYVQYYFPIPIPAGSRLAGKQQSNGTGSVYLSFNFIARNMLPSSPLGLITTYGADLTDSGGTQIDPGGTADTEGAYSQITASATYPIKQLIMAIGQQSNTTQTSQTQMIDLAIGPATETPLISNLGYGVNTFSDVGSPIVYGPFDVDIPAATRLAVRSMCSINDATDRLFDVIIYGVS